MLTVNADDYPLMRKYDRSNVVAVLECKRAVTPMPDIDAVNRLRLL